MWQSVERWSWVAGILSAVIGLVTYLGAQRDARQLRRDQDAFYDVQAELLDVVRKLDQAAGSRGGQPRSGDDPASVLRKRREELEKAAARLQRRKRGFATAARRLIALALVLFAVGVALNKHVAVAAVAAIHRHLLGFAEDIGLAGTPGWLLASFICGAAFAIVVLPVRIFSAREFRAELVLAPVRRKFLAAPGLSKRQKDARGMRFLEASGHNPLSGAIATFALAVAVLGASISYTGAEACDPAELMNPFCLRPVRLAGWDVLSPGLGVVADLRAGWLPALVAVLVAGAMRTGIDRLVRRLDPPVADAWPAAKIFGLVAVLTILVLVASSASTLYLVAVIGYYSVCLPATARFVQRAPAVRSDALRRVKDLVEPSTR